MTPNQPPRLQGFRSIILTVIAAASVGSTCQAQGMPYTGTSNYNYGTGGPTFSNYNYGYMRYGMPGVGASPWSPNAQSQPNSGMRTDQYDAWSVDMDQAANLYNQQAITQAIQNQQQLQANAPRYNVRKKKPRMVQADPDEQKPLPRNQLVAADGKVLWPSSAPGSGDLGKARAGAEAAIALALKEHEASGKASVSSVVQAKERLYDYGRPSLKKAGATNRASAKQLLKFFSSLEQMLDSLAGI